MSKKRKMACFAMIGVVLVLGMEYVVAKAALEVTKPISLVVLKYAIGLICILIIKAIKDRRFFLRKRDIPYIVLCAIFGDILYYASEYSAMEYLPVSVITIILAFVPVVSLLLEVIIYKRRPSLLVVVLIIACVIGVCMVMGADIKEIISGNFMGYLLAFSAVILWNVYIFITKVLSDTYSALNLSMYQLSGAVIIGLPYLIMNFPEASVWTGSYTISILYLGIFSTAFGFLGYVYAVETLGVTPTALFNNMLPITATFFGWLILKETLTPLQFLGGAVVLICGSLVIWYKGKEAT
jgi:drug/metabolite transporter (DMT)-like permease